jgi:hypothetical protein
MAIRVNSQALEVLQQKMALFRLAKLLDTQTVLIANFMLKNS